MPDGRQIFMSKDHAARAKQLADRLGSPPKGLVGGLVAVGTNHRRAGATRRDPLDAFTGIIEDEEPDLRARVDDILYG